MQIFLKTYKKQEIKNNEGMFSTNASKNWVFKTLSNFMNIIENSKLESSFFLNAKINLYYQLISLLFYLQLKTISKNPKRYNAVELKLSYPLIKSIKTIPVISIKIDNFLKFLNSGFYRNNKFKNAGQLVFLKSIRDIFTGLYTNKNAQSFFSKN